MGTLGKTRAQTLFAICIAIASITTESSAAGRSTSAAVNTILNGKGAPKSSLGIDGDFFIDTRSLLIYGPKAKGKWPVPVSLQGPTGPAGSAGKSGVDGKSISNVSAITGAQGAVGPQGEKGEKGEKGEQGATGAVGPQGPSGVNGSNGAQGAQGVQGVAGATGATGAQGVTGPQGVAGVAGAVGAQGAKGETGTSVATEISIVEISNMTLATSTAFAYISSDLFGEFLQGNKYSFQIFVEGTSSSLDLYLGAELASDGNTLSYRTFQSLYKSASQTETQSVYGFLLIGTIEINLENSALLVKIIDGRGGTATKPLTLSGKAYITSVGAIR